MSNLSLVETSPAPIVTYHLTDEQIAETRAKYAALEATTPAGYEEVRQAIAVVRGTRTGVERRRVELKAAALDYGRRVDAEAKRLTSLIESIEEPLVAKKQAVDDDKARLRAEQEAAKLREIEARLAQEREAEEARLKAIRDAEEARLAAVRAQLIAERAQLEEERRQAEAVRAEARAIEEARQAEQLEQERLARAEEDARLRAQRESEQAARAAEDARLKAEREALNRERRALEEARLEAEQKEFQRLAALKAEKDEADRIESARIAAAEREAMRAELLPDAKKLDAFAIKIRALQPPAVKSKPAKEAIAIAMRALEQVADSITALDKVA